LRPTELSELLFETYYVLLFCVQDEALLDDIIDRLLDGRSSRPGKPVALSESEVRDLYFSRVFNGAIMVHQPCWRQQFFPLADFSSNYYYTGLFH